MKKLLFLNGMSPTGTAITADDFRTAFPEVEVIVLDDLGPIDTALSEVAETCENEHPDVIVGVGIGGMIAEQMHGFHKVLINPEFIFPQGTCSDSNKILDNQFKGITEFDKENTYAFISDEFNLMGDYQLYHDNYPIGVRYPGTVGTPKYTLKLIVPLIRVILKLQ